ncbi:MAG TPA: ATP-binding protein [Azospirillaceae bacterium]|nr:ATP-binding protein [Azospirillaceae bacterium]
MPLLTFIPSRLIPMVVALVATIILAICFWLPHDDLGPLIGAVATAVLVLAVAALLRGVRQDWRMVESYLQRLGVADDETVPVPGQGSEAARETMLVVARLHRRWRLRRERVAARLDATESLLEALHDPLILVDAERQVLRANQAARNLFGEKVTGRDLAAVVRNPQVLGAVEAVLGGTASRLVEFTQPVPVERVFQARVKPLRGAVMLTLHDITAIKRSDQTRVDFIANASHELRTPLSTLLGFIETLRGPARDDPEAHDRFLTIMHDQASRMSRLVRDLLSLSRIEQDEHMPPTDAVDVAQVVGDVAAALELQARARKIRLRLEIGDNLPPVVGDEDQIAQVVQNLLSNAIKYTREGTDVTVSAVLTDGATVGGGGTSPGARWGGRQTGRMIAVAVIDHGDGIDRAHLPRLTERFYRADAARSKALGGTGLGLAIVKHIVNRHRGRLTIESEVGRGSTFTVYLPAAHGAEAAWPDESAA